MSVPCFGQILRLTLAAWKSNEWHLWTVNGESPLHEEPRGKVADSWQRRVFSGWCAWNCVPFEVSLKLDEVVTGAAMTSPKTALLFEEINITAFCLTMSMWSVNLLLRFEWIDVFFSPPLRTLLLHPVFGIFLSSY